MDPTKREQLEALLQAPVTHHGAPIQETASGLLVQTIQLNPQQLKGRNRNKPCPCKSGRKTKDCHGRGIR